MKIKTSELTGAALDWAVSKCEGIKWEQGDLDAGEYGPGFKPSTNWSQGGPIIERETISIAPCESMEEWAADAQFRQGVETQYGPTPLIAAMRCYCCATLGDEVDIPQELQPCQQPNL